MKSIFNLLKRVIFTTLCLWLVPNTIYPKVKEQYKTYAIIIGISDNYANSTVDNTLKLPERIERLIPDINRYFDGYTIMTINESIKQKNEKISPRKDYIQSKLSEIKENNEIDMLLFYYGSHGKYDPITKSNLLTYEGTDLTDNVTYLNYNQLKKWTKGIGKRRVIIVESCSLTIKDIHVKLNFGGKTPKWEDEETYVIEPAEDEHLSVFIEKLGEILQNEMMLYTPETFYAAIGSDLWKIKPNEFNKISKEFYIVDKRPHLSIRLSEDAIRYFKVYVYFGEKMLGELDFGEKTINNRLIKNKREGDKITITLKIRTKEGYSLKDIISNIPVEYGNRLKEILDKEHKIDKGINIQKGHFTEYISMKDIIQKPEPVLLDAEFVKIRSGQFSMGSLEKEEGRDDDEIQHNVELIKDIYMQNAEVTQGQWEYVMGENPCAGKPFVEIGPQFPIVYVSWKDVEKFIEKLNKKDKNYQYRLPTEEEWEYACRAGENTRFNWGDVAECSKANFGSGFSYGECKDQNPGKMTEVKRYEPNNWGLYDMHGNVWEWCADNYENTNERITRGGSQHNKPKYCRSANRGSLSANVGRYDQGFRLVLEKK